jgi:hypothetical protein
LDADAQIIGIEWRVGRPKCSHEGTIYGFAATSAHVTGAHADVMTILALTAGGSIAQNARPASQ